MKKQGHFFKLMVICCAMMLLIVGLFPISNADANEQNREIKLSLFPSKELFTIDNLKPGDWMTRTLTIQNKGNQDFLYRTEAKFVSGSEMLFNELLLEVSKDQTVLYGGKLSDFRGFEPRKLDHQSEEALTYTVTFPYESGNEFQGLATKFQIVVSAEAELAAAFTQTDSIGDGQSEASGSILPKTGGTSPFIYLLIGTIIIIFGFILFYNRKLQSLPFDNKGKNV